VQDPLHTPRSLEITVATAAAASTIVDAAAVRAAIEGLESVPDSVLVTRIAGATAGISRVFGVSTATGAKLLRQQYVEVFGGGGGVVLQLNRWPVEALTLTVEVAGQILDSSELEIEVAAARVRRVAGWRAGATLTYWAGWVLDGEGYPLPDEVRTAALLAVEYHLRPVGIVQLADTHYREHEGEEDITYLPPEAIALLRGLEGKRS
jgi:hypothetical protein